MLRMRIATAAIAALILGSATTGFAQDASKPKSPPQKGENVQVVDGKEQVDLTTGQVRGRGEGAKGEAERRMGRGEEVAWKDLPAPVLDAFSKVFVNANPATATKLKLGRVTTFEARESDSAEMVFARATEDGTILEVGRKAKSIPAPVQAFIDERLGGQAGTVREVSTTYYEIEVARGANARLQRMNVNAAGQPVPGAGLAQMMDRGPIGPRGGGEKPVATPPGKPVKPQDDVTDIPARQTRPTEGEKPKPKDAPKGPGQEKPKGPK